MSTLISVLDRIYFTRQIATMNAETVRERLQRICAENGGQAHWARQHGISPAYVSDVINGRREPGKIILAALSLEKIIDYRKAT